MKKVKYIKNTVRAISLLLVLITALSVLAGCSRHVTDGAVSDPDDLRVVGTVGGYDVLYDEYRYVVLSCKSILSDEYGEEVWSDPDAAAELLPTLEAMVEERITANYAVLLLCDANGYTDALSDKDAVKFVNETVDEAIYMHARAAGLDVEVKKKGLDKVVYKYGKGALDKAKELYRKSLADYYITERVMRLTLGVEHAFSKLSEILTYTKGEIIHKSEDIEAFMRSDEFICTRHVFIEKSDKVDREAAKKLAEEAYGKYLDGASFDSLIGSKYNSDMTMPYKGYYFTYGEMDEAYEEAAFDLEVGEVSEVVETDTGFFIIQRYSKDEAYMVENLETFANQIVYSLVDRKVRALQSSLTLEKNEFGRSINIYEMED